MRKDSRIYVAGHRGLVGSAIMRQLHAKGYSNIVTRTHIDLDLTEQQAVREFFQEEKLGYIFLCAAKVGGIVANSTFPADFIYQNLQIQDNIIHEAWRTDVKRLLFLGSSCIYPRDCPQPIKEEYLLTGPLEATNRAYAVAKIAGIEMCWSYNKQYGTQYLSIMPTNLFGPGDNYNLETSHVVPALIRKMHEAKESGARSAQVWGSGAPKREFLYSDDLGEAALHLMTIDDRLYTAMVANHESPPLINIGSGKDLTIKELAELIKTVVGFEGNIDWDQSKPDGTPRKLLDISKISQLGWKAEHSLKEGIRKAYADFLNTRESGAQTTITG
ncbi:MAG: GDP-L-fucose synthase family protein [Acidiferrobacterales bacterium]